MTALGTKARSSCGKLVLRACTVLLTATATILTGLIAIVLPASRHGLLQLAIVAALFQFLTLIPLLIFCFLSPSRRSSNLHRRRIVTIFGVTPFAIAASITIVCLVWLRMNSRDIPDQLLGQQTSSIVVATIFMWAASVLAQSLFYFSLLRAVTMRRGSAMSFTCASPTAETAEQGNWKTSFSTDGSPRSKRSGRSSDSSRRPELPELPYTLREAGQDGFDSWDTSNVSPQNKQTILTASASDDDMMEILPIPDPILTSRPPSASRTRRLTNELQTQGLSIVFDSSSPVTTPEEAHIHPLFRSDSPSPPVALPGTVVTASPLSGQVISPERVLSTRKSRSSLGGSRTPQTPASPFTDEPKTLVTIPESLSGPLDDPPKAAGALPSFILAAGARDSFIDYGRRKESASRDDC